MYTYFVFSLENEKLIHIKFDETYSSVSNDVHVWSEFLVSSSAFLYCKILFIFFHYSLLNDTIAAGCVNFFLIKQKIINW